MPSKKDRNPKKKPSKKERDPLKRPYKKDRNPLKRHFINMRYESPLTPRASVPMVQRAVRLPPSRATSHPLGCECKDF